MSYESELVLAILNNDFNKMKHYARHANLDLPVQLPTYYSRTDELILPLNYAVNLGRTEMVRYLLEHGAKANSVPPKGYPSLYIAVEGNMLQHQYHVGDHAGNKEIVQLLLEHGAEVNYRGFLGQTAIYCAVSNSQNEIIPLLLRWGADVNYKADDGATPLWLAINRHRNFKDSPFYSASVLSPENFLSILMRSVELNVSPQQRNTCIYLLYSERALENKPVLTSITNLFFYEALLRQELPIVSQILGDYKFQPSPSALTSYLYQRNLDQSVIQTSIQFIDKLTNGRILNPELALELKTIMQNFGLNGEISPPCVVDNNQQNSQQRIQDLEQRCTELTREVEALKNILRQGNMNVVPEYNTPRLFKMG